VYALIALSTIWKVYRLGCLGETAVDRDLGFMGEDLLDRWTGGATGVKGLTVAGFMGDIRMVFVGTIRWG